MDKRWQLVLDCLECEKTPFSKASIIRFRAQLIKRRLDRRLIERTVELAKHTGGFGARNLRGALDSSPLWGAAFIGRYLQSVGSRPQEGNERDSKSAGEGE